MEFSSDVTQFQNVVESRRSVRLFDGTAVPEAVVNHCLDLALLAPNSSNLQPWEFYWVRTAEKREKLVQACLSQAAAKTAAELIVCVARTKTWKRACADMVAQLKMHEAKGTKIPKAATNYYNKLVPLAYTQGPLGIIGWVKRLAFFLIGLRQPMMREPVSRHDMRIWATKSTALACENLMLGFRAHGFDSCPMEGIDSTRVKRLLKLPGDAIVLMVLGIGKRRPEGVTLPQIRGNRSWFVKEV